MSHRAKHLRRNWTPERVAQVAAAAGPSTTARTTGAAALTKAVRRARRFQLPVSRWLSGGVR